MCLSAYYPFLLSRNHYIIIKNEKLVRFLINRSIYVRPGRLDMTRPEDRNKMAMMGFISHIISGVIYVINIFYGLWGLVLGLSDPIQYRNLGGDCAADAFVYSMLIVVAMFFLFRFDYSMGIRKNL